MYLMYLLILILCLKGSNSELSTYFDNSGQNFLCGCERDNQNDKNITIKCGHGQVIQMEPFGYMIRDSIRSDRDCGSFNYSRCWQTFEPNILNLKDRIEVYKKCSHQNSCNIKIGGVEDGQQRMVDYPFYCHSERYVIDLSQETVKTINHPVFYFTGEKLTGRKIDCDCFFSCSDSPLDFVIYRIHLKPNSSSRVGFLTQNVHLFKSYLKGMKLLYTYFGSIGPELKLEIRGMEPDKDDVIFFRLWGYKTSVNCSGCTNTTERTTYTPKPITTDSVDSTPDAHSPASNTDQTYYVSTIILGGILTAVIIIVLVGVSLYCCLRRRKKQQKTPGTGTNAPGNNEQSHYDNLDMTRGESNYSNLTVSDMVQHKNQR